MVMPSPDLAVGRALAALADPTRRAVVELLRGGPKRAGELADSLGIAPPSLSRHLRVLRNTGLIVDEEPAHDARIRLYRLQPDSFAPLRDWLGDVTAMWSDQLNALKAHAERGRTPRRAAPRRR
jgi:DNA-binding transcriptional ArsR family regulator